MNRRHYLRAVATGSLIGVAGCSAITGGGDGDTDIGHRITDESGGGEFVMNRVDFVDRTGTLGQLDQADTDTDADDIVNEYTEDDWQRMDTNDLQVARRTLENNDSSVGQIRSWVERALNRNLEDNHIDTMDSPPGPEEPDERALIYGIGSGMNSESRIGNSVDAANTLKPLAEKFASEYLENDAFEAWITSATLPVTEGRFVHLPITIAYSHEGTMNVDYVEDAVPDTAVLPDNGQSIRSAEESVYSAPERFEYLTGFEYEKSLRAADEGFVEQDDDRAGGKIHPTRSISTAVLGEMWSMVDSTRNDLSYETAPPNGIVTHVSKEFGRSVEHAFDTLDAKKLQYMENIGRGIQLFYENNDLRTNLAVGGTLREPAFYEFPDGMKEKLWNFNYDTLSSLEG